MGYVAFKTRLIMVDMRVPIFSFFFELLAPGAGQE